MSKSYKQNRQDDLSSNNPNKGSNTRNKNNRRRGASLLDLEDASLQEMFASRFSATNDCDD